MILLLYLAAFAADVLIAMHMISQLIEQEIGPLELIVIAGFMAAVNALMLVHASDPLGPIAALLVVAFAALYRLLWQLAGQREIASIEAADLEHYRHLIETRPDLPYPYQALGDYFFKRGMWEQAVGYYQQALKRHSDPEVVWRLKYAEKQMERERLGLRQCPRCLADTPRNLSTCRHCGHFFGVVDLSELFGGRKFEIVALGLVLAATLVVVAVRLWGHYPRLLPVLFLLPAYAGVYAVLLIWRRKQAR
ncbi:MAG: hypothetical protein H5T86_13230 [Armatimonadetes bacterium]|nr:hypothetical protein [Armatimonadota bacterium]